MIKWMTIINMIRGTNHDQDARFSDKTKKMLIKSTWPDKYDIKVDLKKVDRDVFRLIMNSSKCGFKRKWLKYWGRKMTLQVELLLVILMNLLRKIKS